MRTYCKVWTIQASYICEYEFADTKPADGEMTDTRFSVFGGKVQQYQRTDARNHTLVCGQNYCTRKAEREGALQAGGGDRL